jgi:pyruvate formate lyase activating enzyme
MIRILRTVSGLTILFILLLSCLYLPGLFSAGQLKEALYYTKLANKIVQCQLCPRRCVIPPAKRGFCGIRENHGGVLYTLSFAKPVSITTTDPIEKKPLYHFLPGTRTFSLATAGCNLRCKFCQNWEISQRLPEEVEYRYLEPPDLVELIKESGCPTVAYTYTEPTIFYEYMLEVAKLSRQRGLKNIMHSNGYINEEPLAELAKYLDGANIDLKGFSDEYYRKLSEGSLEPVLNSLKLLKRLAVHTELTNLVIDGFNDDTDTLIKMCLWIKDNLGADTPLHFSRAWPMYKLTSINPTPVATLERARQIALDCGLKYVYIGNIASHPAENTYCPKCGKLLIERRGYFIAQNNVLDGRCKFCEEKIDGVWQ